MLDAKNTVNLTCGIVADPETVGSSIYKFRVAIDFAGQEKDSDNKSGYFDVVYYGSNDNPNAKFVSKQIADGNMKKGSQIQLVGRLVQERFKTADGKNASKVVVVAESLTYAGGGQRKEGAEGSAKAASGSAVTVPDEF